MILLDTHAAIWILCNDPALGKKARDTAVTALAEAQLAISAISFWEIALLIAKGRLRSLDDPAETRRLMLQAGVRELLGPLHSQIPIVELADFGRQPARRVDAVGDRPDRDLLVGVIDRVDILNALFTFNNDGNSSSHQSAFVIEGPESFGSAVGAVWTSIRHCQ